MFAFVSSLFGGSRILMYVAAAAAGAMFVSGVYFYGKSVERQQMAVEALETSIEHLRERNEINDQVSSSDAAALCSDFGLPDSEQAECVRRIREASAEP